MKEQISYETLKNILRKELGTNFDERALELL
jgi:hypothetical protein